MNDRYALRLHAVRQATAIVGVLAEACPLIPPLTLRIDKAIEIAEWLIESDEGDDPDDFDGEPISPEMLREMVQR